MLLGLVPRLASVTPEDGTITSFTALLLSGPMQQGAHCKRKGHSAHLHTAPQHTTNSLENQLRHASKAAGFIHGRAARPPKMFPEKYAHTKHLKIHLEKEKFHCNEWY